MNEIFEQLSGVLAKEFGISQETITITSVLCDELGIGRDDMLDLADAVEKEFKIGTDLNEFMSARTTGDVVAIIYQAQIKKGTQHE